MIIITGAAGFIGSCLITKLNNEGYIDLVLVDDFSKIEKENNWKNKKFSQKIDRNDFIEWALANANQIEFIFHIGARTDTAEFNYDVLYKLNVEFTQALWHLCVKEGLPVVYASSAATYGLGEHGFDDNEADISKLNPLNPYGKSKNDFDIWALAQERKPYFWAGLKFFNVYGPNEYHKGRMASVIMHAARQIKANSVLKLFKSHKEEYEDGGQQRDFVYVKDVVNVLYFWLHHRIDSGIYNLGSGTVRTFNDLGNAVFNSMNIPAAITYIDTPEDIRDKYQYYTKAEMKKLLNIGYNIPFHSLEEGVEDYVKNYLLEEKIW
ncbi:MAG: ADP-glyceromanno-heptose 6-epimerase [Bacteroidetes bacterium]|nr:ADP-glyceromanno-heptose 6-epimerase [Bacteroidota bacterium]